MTSWKTEVQADSTGTWAGNGLRFPSKDEAESYVEDLADRWTSVRETRVVEVDEPVTHFWLYGKATRVEDADARVEGAYPKFDS